MPRGTTLHRTHVSDTLPAKTSNMHTVLLSGDLMIVSAAQGAADRHGVDLTIAGNERDAAAAPDEATRLIVIDLRLPTLNIGGLVSELRRSMPQALIVACGPHVHEQALAAAVTAGCDEVITRGQFERRLDALLAKLTEPGATEPAAGS